MQLSPDTVQIGATKRGGSAAYMFGGTVHSIRVYGTILSQKTFSSCIDIWLTHEYYIRIREHLSASIIHL